MVQVPCNAAWDHGSGDPHAFLRFRGDMKILGVVPERTLSIVSVEADEVGVRLRYSVDVPIRKFSGPPFDLQEWGYEVADDSGTTYAYGGGAQGRTDGVRTVTPPPPREARELMITLSPYMRDFPRVRVRVRVPCPGPWVVPGSDLELIDRQER